MFTGNIQYTQGTKDCVIVSIANFLNEPYENVIQAAASFGLKRETIHKRGLYPNETDELLKRMRPYSIFVSMKPRRGQEKLIGLARWHNHRKNHHMNIISRGTVYDTDRWTGTIENYRRRYSYHLVEVLKEIKLTVR